MLHVTCNISIVSWKECANCPGNPVIYFSLWMFVYNLCPYWIFEAEFNKKWNYCPVTSVNRVLCQLLKFSLGSCFKDIKKYYCRQYSFCSVKQSIPPFTCHQNWDCEHTSDSGWKNSWLMLTTVNEKLQG